MSINLIMALIPTEKKLLTLIHVCGFGLAIRAGTPVMWVIYRAISIPKA